MWPPMKASTKQYRQMANAIRALSMDAIEKAKSGHPGMPMGMADVATILFSEFLKFNPKAPDWPNRDRFVLSAGHGSMLLYSLLYLTGYRDISIDDIKSFRQLGSKTAGHPEVGFLDGIEMTTGPLGQGLASSVGMALAERVLNAKFGNKTVDHYTYVIAGDGCLMEGIAQEALSLAGHLNLNKLIILFDDNQISIDGPTDLAISDNYKLRLESCCWDTQEVDGHDHGQIRQAISNAKKSGKPSFIACKTIIGYGSPSKSGTAKCHGAPLGVEEIERTRKNLNWQHEPFTVPDEILGWWRDAGEASNENYNKWVEEHDNTLNNYINFDRSKPASELLKLKQIFTEDTKEEATRKTSGKIIAKLSTHLPQLIGGSADLTDSNNTKSTSMIVINKNNYDGNYIYYGIREHAMAAIMNGLALYKGFIPYAGTFLVFTDYCRPAIRLSALMQQQVIYVMTHDSIGLGEDGPTHQPVEHLSSLRAMPNLNVFRPADKIEALEAWQLAIESTTTPSLLSLTRQDLPLLRKAYTTENLSAKGAYIMAEGRGQLEVTIFATGSEVEIALNVRNLLHAKNIGCRVISMPCMELFDQQPKKYKESLLDNNSIKVAIEAACKHGWGKYIGTDGIFIGMSDFGSSGPAKELYKHFGITVENTFEMIMARYKA
jgi:transketolase